MWHEIFMDKQLSSYVAKIDHVTPLLKDLHWLPIAEPINFKICLLTFKGLHDLSPSYIKELLTPYCLASMLRSSSTLHLAWADGLIIT